jgi:hypothetical protein
LEDRCKKYLETKRKEMQECELLLSMSSSSSAREGDESAKAENELTEPLETNPATEIDDEMPKKIIKIEEVVYEGPNGL